MSYGLVLQTAPTTEPLELHEAKEQLGIAPSINHDDALILGFITAARQYVEEYTGRQLITATRDLFIDCFPPSCEPIYLPRPPLLTVSSITYVDSAGDSQTWSAAEYRVSITREPGTVTPIFGGTYPTARNITDSVRVRYTCGYGAAAAVPAAIKSALKLLVTHWYENRSATLVGSISKDLEFSLTALLDMYRVGDEFHRYDGLRREVYA